MKRYTLEERNRILEWIYSESRKWDQFVGCVLIGSGAADFTDQYSDIDILTVSDSSLDINEISIEWNK